jgi:hypothetical protein
VPLDDAPEPPSRALEFGIYAGIANRPSETANITYGPAVAWGVYMRPEITSWLGVRMYYREEYIPVTIEPGGFDTQTTKFGNTTFDQPSLHLRSLGMRVEPQWVATPRLRIMAILGVGWLRYQALPATSTGDFNVQTAKRSAVELDYLIGVGASFDVVPDWVIVGASFDYGFPKDTTGNAHSEVQAFSGGKKYSMGPLPNFEGLSELLFSVGVLL